MKILVTGAAGQLGYDVVKESLARGHETRGIDIDDLDLRDAGGVESLLADYRPDMVIHCAAWTAVDAAEDHEEDCRKINAMATANLAAACAKTGAAMIYLSTDYVFDGEGERAWEPDDEVSRPLNVYGRTKFEGEEAVRKYLERYYIVRIAWVFGLHGKNFVRTMLELSKKHKTISVVSDQFGTPTYTPDLAVLLLDMAGSDRYGTYHATNEGGFISWYEFALEIFRQAGIDMEVRPVLSSEYPTAAKRPKNSRLSKDRLEQKGFERLPDWKDALSRYLKEIRESDGIFE